MRTPMEMEWLHLAQQGDRECRERLIEAYRFTVLQFTSQICRRSISWHHDEASIGLLALDEAIHRFSPDAGKSFENYLRLILTSRLNDYFRKQRRIQNQEQSLNMAESEEEWGASQAEIASSMIQYEKQQKSYELAEEIALYNHLLEAFDIRLEELEELSPGHRDSRKQLMDIAKQFSKDDAMVAELFRSKQLPLKSMVSKVTVSRKTLERHRKYLIALIILFHSPELSHIRNTISFSAIEG